MYYIYKKYFDLKNIKVLKDLFIKNLIILQKQNIF